MIFVSRLANMLSARARTYAVMQVLRTGSFLDGLKNENEVILDAPGGALT